MTKTCQPLEGFLQLAFPLAANNSNFKEEDVVSENTVVLVDEAAANELDDAAKEFLMDKGYNPDYGARPLRRAIGSYIEDPLAESLLSGEYLEGQTIEVTHKEGQDHLYFTATGEPTKSPESSAEAKPESAEDAEASAEASSDGASA